MIANKNIIFSLQKMTVSILFVCCFISSTLHATEEGQELTLEVYPKWYSKEDYTIQGNIGLEQDFQNHTWVKYYTRPSFSYALDKNWGLHAGLGMYYTDYEIIDNNVEIRPFLGISHYYTLSEKWKLSSYFRAEQRYHYNTSNDEKDSNLRLRFRLRTDYTFNPLSTEYAWHKLTLGLEGFKSNNISENAIDTDDRYKTESRFSIGVERSLNAYKKIRFELLWKYQVPLHSISEVSINTIYFKIQYFPIWGGLRSNRLFDREINE